MVRKAYSSRVTSKGQVTVPQEIRLRLGLREGDRLEFLAEDTRTVIRRARVAANPFAKYAGALGTFPAGKKAINAWLRGLRDEGPAPLSQGLATRTRRTSRTATAAASWGRSAPRWWTSTRSCVGPAGPCRSR